jgi:quercetin dioxygenase-like cupin family protein
LGGDVITCKVSGAETQGEYAWFETVTPPGAGPPPHVHHREEEIFYIVEGRFEFRVATETLLAEAGCVLNVPAGIPHRFTNVGESPGTLLVMARPAGMEAFFAELCQLPLDAPPDMQRLAEIGDRFGIEFLSDF